MPVFSVMSVILTPVRFVSLLVCKIVSSKGLRCWGWAKIMYWLLVWAMRSFGESGFSCAQVHLSGSGSWFGNNCSKSGFVSASFMVNFAKLDRSKAAIPASKA